MKRDISVRQVLLWQARLWHSSSLQRPWSELSTRFIGIERLTAKITRIRDQHQLSLIIRNRHGFIYRSQTFPFISSLFTKPNMHMLMSNIACLQTVVNPWIQKQDVFSHQLDKNWHFLLVKLADSEILLVKFYLQLGGHGHGSTNHKLKSATF